MKKTFILVTALAAAFAASPRRARAIRWPGTDTAAVHKISPYRQRLMDKGDLQCAAAAGCSVQIPTSSGEAKVDTVLGGLGLHVQGSAENGGGDWLTDGGEEAAMQFYHIVYDGWARVETKGLDGAIAAQILQKTPEGQSFVLMGNTFVSPAVMADIQNAKFQFYQDLIKSRTSNLLDRLDGN